MTVTAANLLSALDAVKKSPPSGSRPEYASAFSDGVEAAMDRAIELYDTAKTCGAHGGCTLPAGHNQGKADVPENHRPPSTAQQLAEHLVEQRVGDLQAAFRILGWKFDFEIAEEPCKE